MVSRYDQQGIQDAPRMFHSQEAALGRCAYAMFRVPLRAARYEGMLANRRHERMSVAADFPTGSRDEVYQG